MTSRGLARIRNAALGACALISAPLWAKGPATPAAPGPRENIIFVLVDDLRYGRPRTTQIDAFVGHEETNGQPTHLMAINLNRQVMVIELPGGEAAKARTLSGPYLFGANEELTPLHLHLQDLDGDGNPDLLLDIRREQLVYLNRDGAFRLPTPQEQAALQRGSGQ